MATIDVRLGEVAFGVVDAHEPHPELESEITNRRTGRSRD
jgi:hypothetical protein